MGNLIALHDKVVLTKIESQENRVGGIIIPDAGKERSNFFRVESAGPGMYDINTKNYFPMSVRQGDVVVVPKSVVTQIVLDNEEYYICREVEILSIIKD